MLHFLLSLLFPPHSLRGEEGVVLTDAERTEMLSAEPIVLESSELECRGMHSIDRLYGGSAYTKDSLLSGALWMLKYKRGVAYIPALSTLLQQAVDGTVIDGCLCPVPLHWSRRFSRGYNQSLLLAEALSKHVHIPVQELLSRKRSTGHQVKRTRVERLQALEAVFTMRDCDQFPHTVYLVDDVCTTGATLEACAKELKSGGVTRVIAIVVGVA